MSDSEEGPAPRLEPWLEPRSYRIQTPFGTAHLGVNSEIPGLVSEGSWSATLGSIELHSYADTPAEAAAALAAKLRDLADVLDLAAEAGHGRPI